MQHPIRISRWCAAMVALAIAGCSGSLAPVIPQPPPAPTGVEVQAWIQTNRSGSLKTLFLRNLTTAPIDVYELTVYGCQNISGECGSSNPNLRVEPGEVALLTELKRLDRAQAFEFQYTYRWRPAGGR